MNKHSQKSPKKILLVENSKTARFSIVSEITKYGHTVTPVNTGKEAVECLKSNTFDLIIMDLLLPELNGYEAAELIRQSTLNKNIPIFAYTASDNESDRRRCQQVGINEYILKTSDHIPLLNKIDSYFNA